MVDSVYLTSDHSSLYKTPETPGIWRQAQVSYPDGPVNAGDIRLNHRNSWDTIPTANGELHLRVCSEISRKSGKRGHRVMTLAGKSQTRTQQRADGAGRGMLAALHLHGTIRTGRPALIAGTDVRTAKAREPRSD
jgi:hypothetical protein